MLAPQKSNKQNKPKFGNSQTEKSKTSQPVPSHQKISQRAYQIYQDGGSADGRDQQDWYKAEQEMSTPRKS